VWLIVLLVIVSALLAVVFFLLVVVVVSLVAAKGLSGCVYQGDTWVGCCILLQRPGRSTWGWGLQGQARKYASKGTLMSPACLE
jgi:hypothetical protein